MSFLWFYGGFGMLMDTEGNACALEGSHTPCSMEMAKEAPDWDNCTRYNHEGNKKDVKEMLDTTRIAPKEYRPEGKKSWEGISLRKWYRHIVGKDF